MKNELETGNINLGDYKNNQLCELINKNLLFFNEENNINWEECLEKFNQSCEALYKD